jgi:hypothetical protein
VSEGSTEVQKSGTKRYTTQNVFLAQNIISKPFGYRNGRKPIFNPLTEPNYIDGYNYVTVSTE